MGIELEEAVEQLRGRIVSENAARFSVQTADTPAVMGLLATVLGAERRVLRIGFPEGDDAALAALVDGAAGLDAGLLERLVPRENSASLTWASRLPPLCAGLERAGQDVVLLLDRPRFSTGAEPGDELFVPRAVELTTTLLRAHKGPIVLVGPDIPPSVALDQTACFPAADTVRRVLATLAAAGADVARIPRHDQRLDRLVAHDLGSIFLKSPVLRRVMARLSVLRAPFSPAVFDAAGASALAPRERAIVSGLLEELNDGTFVVPAALSQIIRKRMSLDDPAWVPEEPPGDVHHFAAQHHRRRFDAARARADIAAAIREELEEIYQLTEAGDATTLLARSLQFVEQYDALGKSLSLKAMRARADRGREEQLRLDAVRAYERAVEHDARDAYAHHYIAYNLDILAKDRARVDREYGTAKDLDRRHAWYHSRHICFLITIGQIEQAREAWERALIDLDGDEGTQLDTGGYRELHAEVARHLLLRPDLPFAREVLDDVPDEHRSQSWWLALDRLFVCTEEDWEGRASFLLRCRSKSGGAGRISRRRGERSNVTRFRPGRVLDRDNSAVRVRVAERAGKEERLSTLNLGSAEIRAEWQMAPRLLVAGTFVELIEYEDGSKEMKVWGSPSAEIRSIPDLPKLFPRPDRYNRRASVPEGRAAREIGIEAGLDPAGAVQRLSAAGLVAQVSRSVPLMIQGGTSRSSALGIKGFEDPFSISEDREGKLLAIVAGPGNLSQRVQTRMLSDAVKAVLDVYRARETENRSKAST